MPVSKSRPRSTSPSPQIDSIWAVMIMIVWRLGGKMIRTVLCCIVKVSSAHTCQQFLKFAYRCRFTLHFCVFVLGYHFCIFGISLYHFIPMLLASVVFNTKPTDWLGRTSPKRPILCHVNSINQSWTKMNGRPYMDRFLASACNWPQLLAIWTNNSSTLIGLISGGGSSDPSPNSWSRDGSPSL